MASPINDYKDTLNKMANLILVRHGQSEWNLQNRFTGWVDVDLTKNGKLEACKAGELIKQLNCQIDSFFSSFQKRTEKELNYVFDVNIKSYFYSIQNFDKYSKKPNTLRSIINISSIYSIISPDPKIYSKKISKFTKIEILQNTF